MRSLLNLAVLSGYLLLGILPCWPAKKVVTEVEVLEVAASRQGALIQIDARVKNVSVKPLRGLQLIFRFEADQNTIVTTQRIRLEETVLQSGEEGEIHGQLKDTPRAVQVNVGAVDVRGIELAVTNGGPFPIE